MKSLKDALTIRESVFNEKDRDDTLDLVNLIENTVNPIKFFEETYITGGMELLFDTVFKRFRGQAGTGIVKLTQSMGGGKTHNMVALGVLATHPDRRKDILGGKYSDVQEEIRLVAYTGRENDLEYGIWGEIARQLGKEQDFSAYYAPLRAPGQSAWVNLLKSDTPTLIMLDELPPYLEYCKTQTYGTGTLLDLTTTALANLFNALNKAELYNVCLVVSDLRATYEQGSQVIQNLFDNLENEINRSAQDIEPVSANTDDLYQILKKRLFKTFPNEAEIDEIALAYQKAVKEAREMNYTDEDPTAIARGIRASYPFHPSIRDLFARFKENPGFQQTRGFIRLTRMMVKQLFSNDGVAHKRYLINPYDIDLNDNEMLTMIKSIKSELDVAISHDIASEGRAVAEEMDYLTRTTAIQDAAKLILMASLSKVTGSVIGLTMNELIAHLVSPNKDICDLKKEIEDYKTKAWYICMQSDSRIAFRHVQNVNARLNDEIRGITYEQAKIHIKQLLMKQFLPAQKDCYQQVYVFPSIEEIELDKNKVTLIVSEPAQEVGLKSDLKKFYQDQTYKNRVMFMTGQRVAMDTLIETTKHYKAIGNILYRMEHEDKLEERDSELTQARDLKDKISANLFSNIRETFVILYFPKNGRLDQKDLKMEFSENNFNVEGQIRESLKEEMKFTTEIQPEKLKSKFEQRIFTTPRMEWSALQERAATETKWPWHKPEALKDLKEDCLRKGLWVAEGNVINKEPPMPETSVGIIEQYRDKETNEVTLKLTPQHGDVIYYEISQEATVKSNKVTDFSQFKTKELLVTFLCIDSKGKNKTGRVVTWKNKVTIKYHLFNKMNELYTELEASSEDVEIRYTTDGSDPRQYGNLYKGAFLIPKGSRYIQAIASNTAKAIYSDTIKFDTSQPKIVLVADQPVQIKQPLRLSSTKETFEVLGQLKALDVKIKGIDLTIQERSSHAFMILNVGEFEIEMIQQLIETVNHLTNQFFKGKDYEIATTINQLYFETGRIFEQWVYQQKKTLEDYKGQIIQPNKGDD